MFRLQEVRFVVVASMLLPWCGCTHEAESTADPANSHVAHVASLLDRYRTLHRGQPPATLEEFKQFANQDGKSILDSAGVESADVLLTSERDQKPLVILFGKEFVQKNLGEVPVMCYEELGVNGSRYVGFIGGMTEEVDAARFKQLIKNP